MQENGMLDGKRILVVDDERDIVESVEDVLEMCEIDSAMDFETAQNLLETKTYDVAVLDIMGVNGYDLLKIANGKGIPAVMLTGRALTVDNFMKSVQEGAEAYLPKDKLSDIAVFLCDVMTNNKKEQKEEEQEQLGGWFDRLKSYFDRKFGPDWQEKYEDSRDK